MNTLKTIEISNAEIYQRITNFGIEVYKQERLNNPDFSYKDILRIILQKLKKYCNDNNLTFNDYQEYGIENKIHFGLLAKKQLSSTVLNAMSVINSDIYTLISQPYTIDSCIKLMKIKESLQRDKRINNQLSNNRNLANSLLRENNRKENTGNTQIIGDNSRSKSKPFFINYDTINLNKLTNEEKTGIKLICKRIKAEKIDYKNIGTLTEYLDNLNKKGLVREDVVQFIMTQCE